MLCNTNISIRKLGLLINANSDKMQTHSIQIQLQKAVKPFLVEQTKDDDDDSNNDENTNSNSNCDTDRCTGVCHR